MLYHQPYGITDPNGPYINGDPSVGQAGSIPPAASIEYPQREIVNLITDAAITPSDGDLHQLSKAVQSGKLIYADDTGTVNILGLNCVPAVAALQKGMIFITKAATTNTGPTTATVNGLTAPVVHARDFTPLLAFDVNAGQMLALAFDGTNFQLVWSATGAKTSQGVLQANYDLYVNGATGDDTLYDGTQATVGSAGHGPFKTIQHGVDTASKLNANGYTITIHVADWATAYALFNVTNVTNGGLVVVGNDTTPANCVITAAVSGGCVNARGVGVGVTVHGFRVTNSVGSGLLSQAAANINFYNMEFAFCAGAHLSGDEGNLSCYGNYKIIGNAAYHAVIQYGTFVISPSTPNVITIVGSVGIGTAFVYATGIGFIRGGSSITTFANPAGIIGGAKFSVSTNAVIDTGGSGVNWYPGSNPGVYASGGQYV
jgi:hypothetical protein